MGRGGKPRFRTTEQHPFFTSFGRDCLRVPLPHGGTVALTSSRSLNTATDTWRAVSSCRDTDPDLFFPVGTTGPALEQIAAAKAVCNSCEAKEPCLEFALTTNQDSGVWGGTSEEERRKLRRAWVAQQRRAAAAG